MGVPSIVLRLVLVLFLMAGVRVQAGADTFSFSAPPSLDARESRSLFAPMMDLLSRETGETFVYEHPESWFTYQSGIRDGRFDLLLDDAHFASWRIASLGHVPLVRVREPIRFVMIATRSGRVYSREDLVGQPVCAYPPPDLGTISFLRKFASPFRLPQVLPTSDPLDRVERLLAGQCAGAVLVRYHYTESNDIKPVIGQLKIIAQSNSYPGLTLTTGPGVPQALADDIEDVLLSRAGRMATRDLRDRLANGGAFIKAAPADYRGLDELLRDYPGFGPDFGRSDTTTGP